jgi:16S rRNA G527 N7-methylase RsmG
MELTERTLKLEIYDFLELVGLPLRPIEEDENEWFLEEFGWEQREMLANAVDQQDLSQYELIWQTEESMHRFFWPLSASTLLSIPHLIDQEVVSGNVIDIGSGMGFAACFMAWKWRDCHVTAVEMTENGNIRAKEIARKAGLTNITFVEGDLHDFRPTGEFNLVTSFLTAHELGSLSALHDLYGHDSHSDEFAAINLEKYQDNYAQFVSDLLNDNGRVFSLERLGHMADQCAWVGGLRNAELFVDLEKSRFVYPYNESWGHRERLPIFVGSRQESELSVGGFEHWYNLHPFGEDVE